MIEEDRLIGGENQSNEDLKTASVRPNSFADYIGQEDVKEYLKIKIASFKKTNLSVGHMLFLGYSGSGKTTFTGKLGNYLKAKKNKVETNINFSKVFDYLFETMRGLLIYAKEGDFDKLFIEENLVPQLAQIILKLYCEHS